MATDAFVLCVLRGWNSSFPHPVSGTISARKWLVRTTLWSGWCLIGKTVKLEL
jgi:hypothetical protein